MESIAEKIKNIRAEISRVCAACGRDEKSVKLMCVSKTKPVSMIMEAYEAGERCFGENYVQELVAKTEQLPKDIEWNMIGPLQKNKIKKAVNNASFIHAVDSVECAEYIDKEAAKIGKIQNILIEINAGNEESKHGIEFDEAADACREIAKLANVKLCGLMCIPPFSLNEDETRVYFRKMKEKLDEINSLAIFPYKLTELSMGMSSDYRAAIEEGSTYIRIGTGIFGARDYSNK